MSNIVFIYLNNNSMGLFDFLKKKETSINDRNVYVDSKYSNGILHLGFLNEDIDITVDVRRVCAPSGGFGVMYDCYNMALRQWVQQGIGETEFTVDMTRIVSLFTRKSNPEDVMKAVLKQHIAERGRLIDSDFCTYVTELYLVAEKTNGHCDRNKFFERMLQVAVSNYKKHFYVTMYKREGMGLRPYLVSFKEYICNN